MIEDHLETFAGLPVEDFEPEVGIESPDTVVYRVTGGEEEGDTFPDNFAAFLGDPAAGRIKALVVGCWEGVWEGVDSSDAVQALVTARDRLTSLRSLFLGDIVSEESEISWINQTDVSALFEAYPHLEHLAIRGGSGLSLGRPSHQHLKTLIIQSGGLGGSVIREIASADFPELEHLELWLGDPNYGNDVTVEDLAPILAGGLFPKLRYLGLRDDANADTTATALAQAPIVERLRILDLSLGTLGDEGAKALLQNPAIRKLEKLDLHYHYLSDAMMLQLRNLGPEVDLADQQKPDTTYGEGERYVAVAE